MCVYIYIDKLGERIMWFVDCFIYLKYFCWFGNDWKIKGILVYEWYVFIYKYFLWYINIFGGGGGGGGGGWLVL